VDGNGVYRSDDGGVTWKSVGLTDTRHIGRIWVDPKNPDVVVVAALGHIFGPNDERGVFRSSDGGQHWDKVLFVDDKTGAIDIGADPAHPEVLFAATWQTRMFPWLAYFVPSVGPGSGIWKSTDEGKTWARLSGNGLPAGSLGRIGLAVAPGTNDQRVYAIIDCEKASDKGLYRSDDGGANWVKAGGDELSSSYFARVTVDPKSPDTVYVMNRSVARSTDAGKSFQWFKGAPGGDDYHFLWINPDDTRYMALASDQGTTVSVDGGGTWSEWYNQPTGQFYHVATDNRFPYHIYSGQQDSGTVETESSSDYGEISFREWSPAGGDERSYVVPDAGDPNIVYVGGLGGHVSRYDKRTGQVQDISAWPITAYGKRPTTVKYHYNWFYPVVADPHKANTLYLGAQVIFKTDDGGMHWRIISPELAGKNEQAAKDCDNNDLSMREARDCGYGEVFSIAPSPINAADIWAGTDDGFVQLTRDGGRHWHNVSPGDMPFYGRVNTVEASPTDSATAYVAVDTHRQDLFRPYIYRTHDYGRTWQTIVDGIPDDQYVYVVRQDPKNPKLLYAGTNDAVYVSFDDGDHWKPLQLNLPTARVRDLTVHGDDLIAATQGRALWVLDDVTPLRQAATAQADNGVILFQPAEAIRVRRNENKDTPLPPEVPAAQNPPEGASIDYWLGSAVTGPVSLAIYDPAGKLVRQFTSHEAPAKLHTEPYFTEGWLPPVQELPNSDGPHRFVWDLRYPRPQAIEYDYSIAAIYKRGGAIDPQGPLVVPGTYTVLLMANGKTWRQPLKVTEDPRIGEGAAVMVALTQQRDFAIQIGDAMYASFTANAQVNQLTADLQAVKAAQPADADIGAAADAVLAKLDALQSKANQHPTFGSINAGLAGLATETGDGDRAPPAQYRDAFKEYMQRLQATTAEWRALQSMELAKLNALLQQDGKAPLKVQAP
jgi:photosystem II stability/assembly factor-like uncharacterized protein